MRPGELIAGRFAIERLVGSGGMGRVFRAIDRASGEAVALKVLLEGRGAEGRTFEREASVMEGIRHPGVVRYVAHGTTEDGAPYLAMEWLEGEDLARRLERGRLSIEDAVAIARQTAEALAALHARGIVHRDVKPNNLFLRGGEVEGVTLLDFGIARFGASRTSHSGRIVGTPRYMAPEQVRSDATIDARADVFSLGCVLYECLTGATAFGGEHLMAVLGKILFAEVGRPGELRPGIPPALDDLCARMLAKPREDRPEDGAAAAAAIAALGAMPSAASEELDDSATEPANALTGSERRVLSVVLMAPGLEAEGPPEPDAETQVVMGPDELVREAGGRGGHLDVLADGTIMVTLVGAGLATDQAAQAARIALALRSRAPGRSLALATGRGEVTGRLPAVDLLDRAARMLAEVASVPPGSEAPITLDEVTAGLLDARFEVVETEAGLALLQGEHAVAAGARTLLGRPTACVGRDFELRTLDALFAECADESVARVVLLTGPAGVGKSRVAQELCRRVRERQVDAAIWIGRGDPSRASAAFGMLSQALRGAAGLYDGEPIEARRAKLAARVAERVGPDDAPRVTEFLGEILGTPMPDDASAPLRAARNDARLMGDQMRRAFMDFLDAECAARPIVLLLEDLQWGDLPTIEAVDAALRRLHDRPLLVVALARPGVHETFPRLWAERALHEICLKELPRKASARLVRQVLGDRLDASAVDRLVDRAGGNAFYLEELIRRAAERGDDVLPETVLSVVQSRLERLGGAERRVLRAASVLGEVFWQGAVEALIGEGAVELDEHLGRLERLEWIAERPEGRFQGERELTFRHALVREAAYGMLTDLDRALGHRLAGEWLERVGEPSPAVIAGHFDRGGDAPRAASWYLKAATQALAGNDLGTVLAHADRAAALGASGEALGEVALQRAEAHHWRGDPAAASRAAEEAIAALRPRSPRWYHALDLAGVTAAQVGREDRLVACVDELSRAWAEDAPSGPLAAASARAVMVLLFNGRYELAEALHDLLAGAAKRLRDDPAVVARVLEARAARAYFAGHLDASRALFESSIEAFVAAGDLRTASVARVNLGCTECQLGAYAEAETRLRAALADGERMSLDVVVAHAQQNLGLTLGRVGRTAEARALAEAAVAAYAARDDRRMEGVSRVYLADVLYRAGDLDAAEIEARRAAGPLANVKPLQVLLHGVLAAILLAQERPAGALAEARAAMGLLAALGDVDEGEGIARLAHVEALESTGDHPAALAALAAARERLLVTAGKIADPERRRAYLEDVVENARTLQLARMWLDEG